MASKKRGKRVAITKPADPLEAAADAILETAAPAPAEPRPAEADPLRAITKWILDGQSEPDIVDAVAHSWPDAQARPIIMKAIEQLATAGATVNADLIKGFAMEGTREVYRKALEVGDHQIALRALKQLVELTK